MRADQLLLQRQLATSRAQAQRLIAAGVRWRPDTAVEVAWKTVGKNSDELPLDAHIELLDVAEKAQERGARVIAITESQSPLARKADLTLIVDHVEDINTQVPMVSRILHLLMIDILVVGVSMRRGVASLPMLGSDDSAALEEDRPGTKAAHRAGLGISAAGDLTQITSHAQ